MQELDYITALPEPGDATINFLRHVSAQNADMQDIELSSLESPSARLAVELYHAERGTKSPAFKIDLVQQPDPRLPSGPAEFVLWHYDGVDPRPALGPPDAGVAQAVAVLASRPFNATDWADVGRKIAGRLGPGRVRDLLAAMTHPPRRQNPLTTWAWLQRVQTAAAFIIAGMDGGWEGSPRKRTLFSLAYGPMDWTVEAAIIALTQIVREQPAATAADVAGLYRDLFNALPLPGGVPYLHALSVCAAYLPRRHSMPLLAMLSSKTRSVLTASDHYWHAVELAREKQLKAAIAELDQAIRLMPYFAAAYHQRGRARAEGGDSAAALDDYTEAIRLDSGHAEYYHNRAVARDRLSDLPGALADFNQALRLNPVATRYAGRAIARGKSGDTAGALADFDEAIRLDPGLACAYLNRAVEHNKAKNYDRSEADCTQAIRLDPSAILAYTNRAAARCELGDFDGAIADCDAALTIDPSSASAYANRGYACLKKGDYQRAIADSDQAIRLRPHAYFYHNRGQAREALGDRRGALADYREALRLMPDHPDAGEMKAKVAGWSKR